MLRIISQAILSAAGVIGAFFVARDTAGFAVYQMVISLVLIVIAAVVVWYWPQRWSK